MSEYQEQPPAISSLSLNTLFDLLSNSRRRAILANLIAHEGMLTVNDLRNEIVVQERDAPITEVPSEEVTQIHLTLRHNHIPKLAETPLVEYEEERNLVKSTEQLEQLEPFLSKVVEAASVQSLCRN